MAVQGPRSVRGGGQTDDEQPERYKHVYFCTSRQGEQSLNKRGNPKAQKSAADALYQKSIWIDIDIEPNNPKHYATHDEAWNAFVALRKKVGLPAPSAVVNTGGGLHIYWISKTPLLPHEWQPYANGLKHLLLANNFKFDADLYGDIARILRVPGTFNHKYDPPKQVQLLAAAPGDVRLRGGVGLTEAVRWANVTAAPQPAPPLFETLPTATASTTAQPFAPSRRRLEVRHRQARRFPRRSTSHLQEVRLLP